MKQVRAVILHLVAEKYKILVDIFLSKEVNKNNPNDKDRLYWDIYNDALS